MVDVKAWRSLQIRDGRLYCDDECRDEDVDRLHAVTRLVEDSVSEVGLAPLEVVPAMVFADRGGLREQVGRMAVLGERDVTVWATRRGWRLSSDQVGAVAEVLERDFPPYSASPPRKVSVRKARPVLPRRSASTDTLFDYSELETSLLEAALAGPIEQWMTFLHPDQIKLVRSNWNGPARVRGPAGTGKTVVGLHRAAYLAERQPGRVLYSTFVRTLPVVLSGLCRRMSPNVHDRIDFTGLHRLAMRILDEREIRTNLRGNRIDTAFHLAWARVGRTGPLAALDVSTGYWKEEIDYVIKGRGFTDFDDYAGLSRVGRRVPLRAEHREAMWDLYREYQRLLDDSSSHDFNDVLIMARDELTESPLDPGYGAVVVDEVQDLPLVGLELLHTIAGDGPDRFLIIGDGQQSVYPGGFNLSEAGVAVTGRAAVLRTNYRNTAEVLEVADAVVAEDSFNDLDGETSTGAREVEVSRRGGRTTRMVGDDRAGVDAAMVAQVRACIRDLDLRLGDMAVLTQDRKSADHAMRVLSRAGLPCVGLLEYDGMTTERIKVGTFKRAKGLEFTYVFLPGLREGPIPRRPDETEDAYQERAARMRRELFVGMTRARDGLWLGYLRSSSR